MTTKTEYIISTIKKLDLLFKGYYYSYLLTRSYFFNNGKIINKETLKRASTYEIKLLHEELKQIEFNNYIHEEYEKGNISAKEYFKHYDNSIFY